ncbi:hypothetical protein F4782DRAFT_550346 [Xylaria castorea]|nr:hypothetical protein F4782DRAFT_550346 [Xylaria castorea]
MELPSRALHLPGIFKFLRQLSRKEKYPRNYLLKLPVELIYLIEAYLTPVDLALLSQTCRSLRFILEKYTKTRKLSWAERRSYLFYRARGLPEVWACWQCVTFHPIVKRDTLSPCPTVGNVGHGRTWSGRRCNNIWSGRRCDSGTYFTESRLDPRHLQLALKYARLQQPKYNSYLQALTAPHHDLDFGPSEKVSLKAHYSAYPKVVAGQDGNLRFLVLSTWRYYKDGGDIRSVDIGHQNICPHLGVNCPSCPMVYRSPRSDLANAVERALIARKNGFTGACRRCATDFMVRLSSDYLELRVWQDFGPEGSPDDHPYFNWPMWWEISRRCFDGPNLYHRSGSLRTLYGPEAPEQVVKPRCKSPDLMNYKFPARETESSESLLLLSVSS